MKAGVYYIGDLWYVAKAEWSEICCMISRDGQYTLKDGRQFLIVNTNNGEGLYKGSVVNNNHQFTLNVDSGTIGCINVKDIHSEHSLTGLIIAKCCFIAAIEQEFEMVRTKEGFSFGNVFIEDKDETGFW